MRPPTLASKVTVSPRSPDTEWSCGHHSVVLTAHTSKACFGEQATVSSSLMGSITAHLPCTLCRVLGDEPKAGCGLAPDLLDVAAHRFDALVVKPVKPAGAFAAILRRRRGRVYMKAYEASATIEATPEVIWGVLTDAPGYSQWDSGVERVEGRIAPEEKIKVIRKPTGAGLFPSR